jgi:hypothetical protein
MVVYDNGVPFIGWLEELLWNEHPRTAWDPAKWGKDR